MAIKQHIKFFENYLLRYKEEHQLSNDDIKSILQNIIKEIDFAEKPVKYYE